MDDLYSKKSNKTIINGTIISTLVLSIFSNAIWEKVISPSSSYIFRCVLTLINNKSQSYLNSLYREISRGSNEVYGAKSYIFIWTFIMILSYGLIVDYKKLFAYYRNEKFFRKILYISIFLIIIVTSFNMGKTIFVKNTIIDTLNNIEIVSPYISDKEYKTLKSQFYSMSGEDDYTILAQNLQLIADNNGLSLKK